MRALDHRLPSQGRSQRGGGRRGCVPPWGFRGSQGRWPRGPRLRRRQPKPSQKSWNLCGNREKNTSGQSGPLWPSGPARKTGPHWLSEALPTVRGPMNMRGPVSIRGPLISRDPSDHQDPLTNRGPPNCQGPYEYEGSCEHQEPSDHQGPLTNRGPPNCQGPSEYQSPLMGRFKLGEP